MTALQNLVICLNGLLPLSYRYEVERAKGYPQCRTQPETDALKLLESFLERHGIRLALKCNIVGHWLAKYPFGGDVESRYPGNQASQLAAKRRHMTQLRLGRGNDQAMAGIVKRIMNDPSGRESMTNAVFLDASFLDEPGPNMDEDEDDDPEYTQVWYEVHGATPTADWGLGPMMRRGQRVREESLEEQALRSRRREAMVLGEMGRPIEREDIIQRVDP
ncbi:MAG: hypothetical protein Q9218_001220 [Villophora microphyllina]